MKRKRVMRRKRVMSREMLARRLEGWAARIRAGRPVRVGSRAVRLPDRLIVETEFEIETGVAELEIEIRWPVGPPASRGTPLVIRTSPVSVR